MGWIWGEQVLEFLKLPLIESGMELDATDIHHKGLAEPFYVMLKISLLAGVFIASPYVLYQAWKFIAPGLYADEKKRIALPFVFVGTIFFFTGAAFCYYGVLPFGYKFLLEFGMQVSKPELMLEEYIYADDEADVRLRRGLRAAGLRDVLVGARRHRSQHAAEILAWGGRRIVRPGGIFDPADPMTMMLLAMPLIVFCTSCRSAWRGCSRDGEKDKRATTRSAGDLDRRAA